MKRLSRRILAVAVLGVAAWAELSYFQFHTYFLSTEVQETLPPMPSGQPSDTPRTIISGSFVEVDIVHKGSGTARIVEQSGVRYLRLENFEVTNGPDLYVYLSESETPNSSIDSLGKYVILGRLKGNMGNQTYEIPTSVSERNTVIIWCQKFGVLFSYAVMR